MECAAGLDVSVAKSIVTEDEVHHGKKLLAATVSMLVGLIKSNASDRVYESVTPYGQEDLRD